MAQIFVLLLLIQGREWRARGLLSRLAKVGIKCTYVLLSGVSYVMKEVTKIILGASSMMANGAAASRVGTACVAMMAKNYHKPVIFCCETYKFTPRFS